MGLIVQDYALLEQSTVLENCIFSALISRKYSYKAALDKAHQLLKAVGMDSLCKKHVCKLSGGQRQRVAIARAMMNDPLLVLADEPTASLDTKNSEAIIHLLLEQVTKGTTLLLVTHNPGIAKQCQNRIHLIDGKI